MIQLMRFVFQKESVNRKKLSHNILFPETLDLSAYTQGDQEESHTPISKPSSPSIPEKETHTKVVDHNESFFADTSLGHRSSSKNSFDYYSGLNSGNYNFASASFDNSYYGGTSQQRLSPVEKARQEDNEYRLTAVISHIGSSAECTPSFSLIFEYNKVT